MTLQHCTVYKHIVHLSGPLRRPGCSSESAARSSRSEPAGQGHHQGLGGAGRMSCRCSWVGRREAIPLHLALVKPAPEQDWEGGNPVHLPCAQETGREKTHFPK